MSIDFSASHFALFGIPERFEVDLEALEQRYRDLQSQVHPDRFANASDAERRLSMQRATQVNEAFETLRSPLARARYLLDRRGVDVAAESNTAMPADFLMEQMEWREAAAESREEGNVEKLDELLADIRRTMKSRYASLGRMLDEGVTDQAAVEVRKLMFLEKLQSEIGDALAELDV